MNLWKHITSPFTKNAPSKTETGAHAPNISSSPSCSSGHQPAPDNSKFKTQPSPLEDLNYNRNGKIARLPRALRDRINLALYNRCTAKELAHALNQMPEVQAILAQYFDGRPLKQQNISEWKLGGYRDWLHHRQLLEQQRELAADAKDLAGTAKGTTESLFGLLTLNYTHLIMNRDKETPEEFEKKRKELSLVSQDISRMHRCHINTRRVEVQETRLDRDEEKTTEQLHFKFMEWAENPAIRRAFILEPMEANRRSRQHFGMPPTSDDLLVEQITRNDPYFNPPAKKQNKYKPIPAEKPNPDAGSANQPPSEKGGAMPSGTLSASRPDKASEAQKQDDSVGTRSSASDSAAQASPATSESNGDTNRPAASTIQSSNASTSYNDKTASQIITEVEEKHLREKTARSNPSRKTDVPTASDKSSSSSNNTSASTVQHSNSSTPAASPKPPLSDYERALLEGKTFLEALYAQSARPKPGSQPAPPASGSSAWDSFCEPVRPSPYARLSSHPASSFKLTFG